MIFFTWTFKAAQNLPNEEEKGILVIEKIVGA
jgi:hypothetical protein